MNRPRKDDQGVSDSLVTRLLGEWIAEVRLDTLPRDVICNAKRSVVDTVAAGLSGAGLATARRVRDLATQTYAPGSSRIIQGAPLDAAGAAFANAASCHALDLDDTAYAGSAAASTIHASVVVLPAVLALADERGLSGDECLAAFVAGCETAYFLCRLVTPSLYQRGWFTTSVIGEIAAAAGCARALSSSPDICAVAVGLAAARAAGTRTCLGNDANLYTTARAAEGGVSAARLAAAGARAARDAIEGPNGFLSTYNDGRQAHKAVETLGAEFGLSDRGVWYKVYPVCSAGQLVGELVEEIVRREGVGTDEVKRVECVVPPLVNQLLRYDAPNHPAEAQFSLPFIVGHILTYGTLDVHALSSARLRDPRLQAAMQRVVSTVVTSDHTSDCDEGPVRVEILLVDGRKIVTERTHARGTPERPLSNDELARKFRACATPVIGPADASLLLEQLWNLERIENTRTLPFA